MLAVLSERAQVLLKHLVELYIREGQPVGSKVLAKEALPLLSSATVRNVLSDLEQRGYITSPHTSSGRIPTAQGIRFFVDSLRAIYSVDKRVAQKVQAQLDLDQPAEHLIAKTSFVLSELTHWVGIVTLPRNAQQILRHVEFLSLSNNRVLVVLVLDECKVQNRIIATTRRYSDSELAQAGNFLNHHCAGKALLSAREALLKALNCDRQQMGSIMKTVVDVASKALMPEQPKEDYILSGQQNLFHHPSASLSQLQKLFEAFTQKQQILYLLDACLQSEGVQIFIGEESGHEAFKEHSMITSCYTVKGEVVGVLGVIGPMRMRYDKVIPAVQLTAKVLGTLLNVAK